MKLFQSLLFTFICIIVFCVSDSFAQLQWSKDTSNPIMSGGSAGTWNRHVFMPNVLYNSDSTRYEMWFGASAGPIGSEWRPYKIGFAISPDGIVWTSHPNPVLEPTLGEWDETTVESPMVIREDSLYKMWYTGWSHSNYAGGIGYATSLDGINWTKYAGNPVLFGTEDWEIGGANISFVMKINNGYKMWYTGYNADYTNSGIGYATSQDGVSWLADTLNNPVLETGSAGQWDAFAVMESQVILLNDTYHMFYTGTKDNPQVRKIGYASSEDGINWFKYNNPTTGTLYSESDPVMWPTSGQWDGSHLEAGDVVVDGDSLRMWYAGCLNPSSTYLWHIGHATLSLDSLYKYDPTGIVKSDERTIPTDYSLLQNYPNPFNPKTNIEFHIPHAEFVTLKIYNLLGQEVATLISEDNLTPGNYEYSWDAGELASGVYVYRVEAGNFIEVKKMILLK